MRLISMSRLIAIFLVSLCASCNQRQQESNESQEMLVLALIVQSQNREKPCAERPLEEAIACVIEGIDFDG